MRKIYYLIYICCIGCFISCSKDIYSCDPVIDNWAHECIAYFEQADRSEIVALPMTQQRAIYVGLSGEKRLQLWHEKFEIVSNLQLLPSEELGCYKEFISFLKPEHFNTKRGRAEISSFADLWNEKMISTYGWDEKKIFLFTHIWTTEEELVSAIMSENLQTKAGEGTLPGLDTKKCECIYSVYCVFSGRGTTCSNVDCEKVYACGAVSSTSACTGRCE